MISVFYFCLHWHQIKPGVRWENHVFFHCIVCFPVFITTNTYYICSICYGNRAEYCLSPCSVICFCSGTPADAPGLKVSAISRWVLHSQSCEANKNRNAFLTEDVRCEEIRLIQLIGRLSLGVSANYIVGYDGFFSSSPLQLSTFWATQIVLWSVIIRVSSFTKSDPMQPAKSGSHMVLPALPLPLFTHASVHSRWSDTHRLHCVSVLNIQEFGCDSRLFSLSTGYFSRETKLTSDLSSECFVRFLKNGFCWLATIKLMQIKSTARALICGAVERNGMWLEDCKKLF